MNIQEDISRSRTVELPPGFCYGRLSAANTGQILQLLNATWPVLYGKTGCPEFSAEYLRWLYDGPNAARHVLMGCWNGGELVGFRAYLHRRLRCAGHFVSGYLTTQTTIAQDLPLAPRLAIASEFTRLHPLLGEYPGFLGPRGEVSFTFLESTRALSRIVEYVNRKSGFATTAIPFTHALVSPRTVRAAVAQRPARRVRDAQPGDAPELARLLARKELGGMVLAAEPEVLWHHICAAPGGRAFVIESGEALTGFLACYMLTTIKDERRTPVLVVEFVCCNGAADLASLLIAAVGQAEACKARGVVIENTTCLAPEDCSEAGVITSMRHMTLAARSNGNRFDFGNQFLCDVK